MAGIAGARVYSKWTAPKLESPAWDAGKIVCTGRIGGMYFLENRTGRDFSVTHAGQVQVLVRTKHGLVPSDAKPGLPIFVPQGETVGIEITPEQALGLVLFDQARRLRIELPGARLK